MESNCVYYLWSSSHDLHDICNLKSMNCDSVKCRNVSNRYTMSNVSCFLISNVSYAQNS